MSRLLCMVGVFLLINIGADIKHVWFGIPSGVMFVLGLNLWADKVRGK